MGNPGHPERTWRMGVPLRADRARRHRGAVARRSARRRRGDRGVPGAASVEARGGRPRPRPPLPAHGRMRADCGGVLDRRADRDQLRRSPATTTARDRRPLRSRASFRRPRGAAGAGGGDRDGRRGRVDGAGLVDAAPVRRGALAPGPLPLASRDPLRPRSPRARPRRDRRARRRHRHRVCCSGTRRSRPSPRSSRSSHCSAFALVPPSKPVQRKSASRSSSGAAGRRS